MAAYNSMADLADPTSGGGWSVNVNPMAVYGFTPEQEKAIQTLYETHLKRPAGAADFQAHRGNTLMGIESAIKLSPEYKARSTGSTPSAAPTAPYQPPGSSAQTGWGFDSPTGGRREFGYTSKDYGQDWRAMGGFDPAKADLSHPDSGSVKYVFLRATSGLDASPSGIAEVVRRLNEQGIPARQVGTDKIDFGLGEGPIDVIRGGTDATGYLDWQWIGPDQATVPSEPYRASMADLATTASPPPTTPPAAVPASPTPEPPASAGVPPPQDATPEGQPATPEAVNQFATTVTTTGAKVLEVKGSRMRILTPTAEARGDRYGEWVDVVVAPRTSASKSMADLAA